MADLTHQFIAALHAGRACLHPTDTLPGLTFDPTSFGGLQAVTRLKGRAEGKPYLALVASLAAARRYFEPLPGGWEKALASLWPGPLSVVWKASAQAPRALVAEDGTIGLRSPLLPVEAAWFRAVLETVDVPLPTTSVNRSGEPPARSFADAAAHLAGQPSAFIPDWPGTGTLGALPSTVIRLEAGGGYKLLRAGSIDAGRLAAASRGG